MGMVNIRDRIQSDHCSLIMSLLKNAQNIAGRARKKVYSNHGAYDPNEKKKSPSNYHRIQLLVH